MNGYEAKDITEQ